MSDSPRIWLSPPHMGDDERRLLLEAFDSNWIAPLGPQVDAFEREVSARLDRAHAAALSSGTAALHLALLLLGVRAGDEVWCSTLTFAATANAITYLGAAPVFVDADEATWTMDAALLEEALSEADRAGRRPKVVIPVDLYGQCADYDPIVGACRRFGVRVVSDAAESLGSEYRGRPAGSLGDLAVLSFNGNKIITTSGGGMIVGDDHETIEKARFLATQARDPAPHYEHSQIGYNYRMSNLLAAIGRGQLRVLDERVARRRAIKRRYVEALAHLPGVRFMPDADHGVPNNWLTCLTIDPSRFGANREDVRLRLADENIEARPVWKPMHLQPVHAGHRTVRGEVAAALFERGLCLPSGSSLSESDQERVIDAVLRCAP